MDLAKDYCDRSLLVMIRSFNKRVFEDSAAAYPFVGVLTLGAASFYPAKLLFAAGLECLPQDALNKSQGLHTQKRGGSNRPLKWDGSRATLQQVESMTAEEALQRPKLLQSCSFMAISFAYSSSGAHGSHDRSYSDTHGDERRSHRFLVFLARDSQRRKPWFVFVSDEVHPLDSQKLLGYITSQLKSFLPELNIITEGYDPWLPISTPNSARLNYRGAGLCFYGPCADLMMVGSMLGKDERLRSGLDLVELIRKRTLSVDPPAYPLIARHAILSLLTSPGQKVPIPQEEAGAATLAKNLRSIRKGSWKWAESSRGPPLQGQKLFRPKDVSLSRIQEIKDRKRRVEEEKGGLRMTYKQPRFE